MDEIISVIRGLDHFSLKKMDAFIASLESRELQGKESEEKDQMTDRSTPIFAAKCDLYGKSVGPRNLKQERMRKDE